MNKLGVQRIDFFRQRNNFQCVIFGALGFSTKLIMERTGLTEAQVTYRLHKVGVRRRDYWNGVSPVAQNVIERTYSLAAQYTKQQIRGMLDAKKGK